MSPAPAALGLYVHWPYCARICPYCDFNVYKAANADADALTAAILADLDHWRARTGPRALASVHFGGGTPSLMNPSQVAAVLDRAETLWGLAPGAEIGLEANPKEAPAFAGLAQAGINRLSLGVQALDDASLARLGRDHDAAMALKAAEAAQRQFARVSIDLIYAREGQSPDGWARELGRALDLGLDHLSLYQLTIEPGTAFARQAERGSLIPPPDDAAADMYLLTQGMTEAAGLPAYEISNHARSAAHHSVHNRLYWEGANWIGVGPGAHSRLGAHARGGRVAAEAARRPADYIAGAASGAAQSLETLDARAEAIERVLMGLRLVEEGLDTDRLAALTGHGVDEDGLTRALARGHVRREGSRLVLTRSGRAFADSAAALLAP
ncbi:radical SAM family heme chaperone HemW [Alkalicaulis satelles]|uniref:Heme chaperone HemW n=1 Tax=Alkalicaulis satelles TaxID=2609175 RepID=A0A5M6ZH15_9PROT|nr:radical SAM family heme chaperone HemW [Alkalicaulis satelles]KAA5804063.1 radical SAM family heme chaperone HemW [Alkalicaulis satelles]